MDLEDIIALTKAGFTKEDIMLLAKGEKDDGDKKDPEDKKDDPAASSTDTGTDTGNSDSKGSEPKPDTNGANSVYQNDVIERITNPFNGAKIPFIDTNGANSVYQNDVIERIIKQLNDLTATIQKSNIKGVAQDTKPEETAESILGGLINPITKE